MSIPKSNENQNRKNLKNNSTIKIDSITTAMQWIIALKKKKTYNSSVPQNNDTISWVFRGHSKDEYELLPSIARGKDEETEKVTEVDNETLERRLKELEERLILRLPSYITVPNATKLERKWIELFIGRHYEFPTPLLDFSRNFLVALFNAVISNTKDDGIVYAVKVKIPENTNNSFDTEKANLFIYSRIPDGVTPYKSHKVFFIEPPYLDQRMIAQEAVFLFSQKKIEIKEEKEKGTFKLLKLAEHTDFNPNEIKDFNRVIRFRIPKEHKENIREELNYIGINHSTLYPDLWGLGEFLKIKFKKIPNRKIKR